MALPQTATKIDIPTALLLGNQWVCYSDNKTPISPKTLKGVTGDLVEGNPDWASYEEAHRAWQENSGWLKGIGREFIKSQKTAGIDLDDCIDASGNPSPYASYVVKLFNSYTEYSPSGRGLHIWVYGSLPSNLNTAIKEDGDKRTEAYDCNRYFTITGKHLPGTPTTIEHRQEQLDAFHLEVTEWRQVAQRRKSKTRTPTRQATMGDTPYGLTALDRECQTLATMPEGGRNHQLNISAFSMGQLVAGHELTRSAVERGLSDAAARAGLNEREIEKTLRSGLEDGLQSPRSAPAKITSLSAFKIHSNENGNRTNDTSSSTIGHSGDNGTTPPLVTSVAEFLCEFTADDAGNGDAMLALFGKEFLWCATRGWFRDTGTHWELDIDGASVKRRAVETLRKRRHAAVDTGMEAIIKCTKGDEGRVNGCVSRFKTLVSVNIDSFDCDPDKLNCLNGVIDLRTGHLEEHNHTHRFTYCLPVDYDPEADYSEWRDYLQGVVHEKLLDYLQMVSGYSLTGHTREEILFYLNGPTRSGKGTFAETFMALLPSPLSTMVDFNSFTAKRDGDVSNFDLAPLKPARMIFASESNRSQSLNPAKIKQLTGGDRIRACFKHHDHFDFRPQFKVWMMSNHPVNGDPEDDALWGRVRVIEFPNSFLGKEDKSKKSRLKEPEMLKGVLAWAVQGSIKWYALGSAGLITPESIVKTTQAQRTSLDYVQQWLDECCEEVDDEESWVANEDVIASYTQWCNLNNVEEKKSPVALSQSLKAKGHVIGRQKKIKGKNKKGVGGLYIRPIEESNGNDGNA